ncbi:hypothetical protein G6L26_009725 [Agrobacterium radiobacter]|uniref:hypothetical protein n=1 Tax=Agrobacterium tumefaciens complex TaxID=1183400 RepID=UPI00080F76C5|nr:hypothetical protein [Agrobacterium tumefaciens]NTA05464.1 hypothetical protein [Agrobacterium tumefaciens]NTA92057.1 hypothetical protein [Agrobacterium tumefaciens]OCJ32213.1 hypothetical protein A6U90_09875 [Agrobacterium tumefaciens]
MSADFQKSITFSIMSAKVEALEDAIRAIRNARQGFLEGILGGEDIDDCIDSAIELLPENVKPDRRKQLKPKEPFDDVLG